MSKGSVLDMFIIPIILLGIGILVYVGAIILNQIEPNISAISPAASPAINRGIQAINTFNWSFLIIAFALGFGSILFGFFYPSHPIFFVLGMLILVISMITTPMVSNVFETFIGSTTVSTVSSSFPIINWFMTNMLPIFMTITGFFMLIILYTNLRGARE